MSITKTTAIYGLFDPREPDVIMYVGKGLAGRAASHWRQFVNRGTACNGNLVRWFTSLQADGVEPGWRFLEENVSLDNWGEREELWRAYWKEKNPRLCNVMPGGIQFPIDASVLGGHNGGRNGGLIGGRRVHELHPGLARENGRRVHELHPEQASEIGRKGGLNGGRKSVENKTGWFATGVQSKAGRVGGRKSVENKTGWFATGVQSKAGRVGGRIAMHNRWHVARGKTNPNCKLCQETLREVEAILAARTAAKEVPAQVA